ncbi:MAG TPA: hypothetical protein DF613_13495 [Lachnospiraceae bacterium]|nr:hypothetical protein [Lachnospiraceae bacterium]
MDRETFRNLVRDRVLLLDGATGSNLLKAGMPAGVCTETWVLEHPQVIQELQRAYVEAGSQILFAPTFSANAIALKERQAEISVAELNSRLAALSREAAGSKSLVAGDMTMTGKQLLPAGTLTFDQLTDCYEEQAAALRDGGVDLFVVETMISLQEMRAAVLAIRRCCDLPILASFTVDESGYTFLGTEITAAAVTLEGLGVDAVGVNCSMGPEQMLPVVEKLRKVTELPVLAKANAGNPRQEDGRMVYPMNAEQYTVYAERMVDAGISLLGGCCGTTPEFVSRMQEMLKKRGVYKPLEQAVCGTDTSEEGCQPRRLATDRRVFELSSLCSMSHGGCVSENPALAECLAAGEYEDVVEALGDPGEGQILLVELDDLGMDADKSLEAFVAQLSASGMPVCFGASSLSILERALRCYCGIAAVRLPSLSGSEEAGQVLARYGAVEYGR